MEVKHYQRDFGWNFQELMLHRVHEILLVASPYDAFILEEDGRLTEQILNEYLGMNLRYAPRVWRVSTARETLKLISRRKFDLVLLMMRIPDMDPISLGADIKKRYSKKPVILLLFDESELRQLPDPIPRSSIDKVFMYSGNADLFPAIVKYIEDKQNVSRDVRKGDVRTIIVIEDNPRYYSLMLPMIYKEIVYHTTHLINRSLTNAHRLLHKRGRPRILMASTYEEAMGFYKRYRSNVLGIISDIRFPKRGVLDDHAGVRFTKWVRNMDPYMPIMLQSTYAGNRQQAEDANAHFLHKGSRTTLLELREFMINNFGFGDFVFRLPSGEIVGRACDLVEMEHQLQSIPKESILYHSSSNHFSNWLAARGEFEAATKMRPVQPGDFPSPEEHRRFLIDQIRQIISGNHWQLIVDFSPDSFDPQIDFVRLYSGSLGGKARGLAFAKMTFQNSDLHARFPDIVLRIPNVAIIGTDLFDDFMRDNDLWQPALELADNDEVLDLFMQADLPDNFISVLRDYIRHNNKPIAVRSSSFLEDAQYNPLSGMFATYMLPNNNPDLEFRLIQLCKAIKRVFASMFFRDPKAIIEQSVHRLEEEKMGVILQELVGDEHGDRYYPVLSGVAQSYNYYPVSYMKREEGVAYVALGLGRTVAEGGKSLRFAPRYPRILPQFFSIRATIENSQREFYALRLGAEVDPLSGGEAANLEKNDLTTAESDGVLRWAASVVDANDDVLRDSLNQPGLRVITFAALLKWQAFPLAEVINELLRVGEVSLGCPVEMEFAVNLFKNRDRLPEFCLLQIKPLPISRLDDLELKGDDTSNVFCRTGLALGNGRIQCIRDIICVKLDVFDAAKTPEIAREIAEFNSEIGPDNQYFLIGPGRWGSADPWLGIPVTWEQICHARIIAEVGIDEFNVDPSFGSHFFQNITSMRIGYLTIDPKKKSDSLDWGWLQEQPVLRESQYLKWIRLDNSLQATIDGKNGLGVVLKPDPQNEEVMNEEESPGI